MRLIDADAMIADLLTVDPQYETMIQWCCTVIDAQPTIEERKTGHWERVANNDNGIDFRCSACHRYRFHNGEMRKRYKFCPACGARMEEGDPT